MKRKARNPIPGFFVFRRQFESILTIVIMIVMNRQDYSSFQTLIELLEAGKTLRLAQAGLLVRMEDGRFLISSRNYTARLSREDFAQLYGSFSFAPLEERIGISEEKDEEYYAWRREKQ